MTLLLLLLSLSSVCHIIRAAPSLCSDGITTGYSDLFVLDQDLLQADIRGDALLFILCPETILDGGSIGNNEGANIYTSNVKIQCGMDGKLSNNCIISGGKSAIFAIEGFNGPPRGVILEGITFVNQTSMGVVAFGDNLEMSLMNCKFTNYTDTNAVGVNTFAGTSTINLSGVIFENNTLAASARALAGGTLNMDKCVFKNNEVMGGLGIVGAQEGGALSITSSCFIQNVLPSNSSTTSVVVLDDDSELQGQTDNFIQTQGSIYDCMGAYIRKSMECSSFSASECLAGSNTSTPTASPTTDTPASCIDLPWVDKQGDNCDWYGLPVGDDDVTYSEGDTRCSLVGSCCMNDGLVANQACCACGGGQTSVSPPKNTPTASPSKAPVINNQPTSPSITTASPMGMPLTPFPTFITSSSKNPAGVVGVTPAPVIDDLTGAPTILSSIKPSDGTVFPTALVSELPTTLVTTSSPVTSSGLDPSSDSGSAAISNLIHQHVILAAVVCFCYPLV